MTTLNVVRTLAKTGSPYRRAIVASTRSASSAVRPSSQQSIIPLSNVEAQWEKLSSDEQLTVHQQLEALQKKDWKELSIDEKKAAYYVAFGPHGPRAPIKPPGANTTIFFGTIGAIAVSSIIFALIRSRAPPPPKTMTKEWQEAATEQAKERRENPITGMPLYAFTT
ncbi:cytochrome c oxidase subunit IV [Sistotremastrum suecicum HHB10207 ss-3]|uniref:Cytochrome c oxidase subunit IV n=1 Tax=Sistotremastrum suecicum HHB10207 ss-3 TaxID=1314776 RepID=A0A166IRG8_9AGAM|nr:cytochrome c oxidase subunit IV [Sistotremastrum suecicum HHB10207 ss-3]